VPPDLNTLLSHLALGPIEFHESVASTNDLGAGRLTTGTPDLTLIIADEQTAGRGRHARRWHTPPGSALAFSLVLHPSADQPLWSHAPLSALAVHDVLSGRFDLPAEIKWPNDVLIDGRKVCGILAEAHWQGSRLEGVVLGTGINVLPEAVPPSALNFPATSITAELDRQAAAPAAVDRWTLLAEILAALLKRRAQIGSPEFIRDWEDRLAFRGARVVVGEQHGTLVGLAPGGELVLETAAGRLEIPAGEVSLRPI
jgi:BirA family biotin operon repressor/biotin-[acetyl-CoA-carboxylase] ligase